MIKYIFIFFIAILVSIVFGIPILKLCKKFHLSQTILHYVDKHSGKSGTPTMGGFIFITCILLVCPFFFNGNSYYAVLILLTMLGYGLLGFLDDFIKIKFHKNEGLRPHQKIIGQVGLALIIAFFVYFKIGSDIDFFGLKLNLGIFIIPFIIIFFVAVTNSVNLTDGLDGLASGVSLIYLIFFGFILFIIGEDFNYIVISFATAGALLGFLVFNCYPAKIFMGDTGSLALGGLIAALAAFTKLELIMPIIGFLFVLTVLSDIIQVGYYKKTHKRIFKMAPLHHHFEQKGVHENRIVTVYILITMFCGVATLLGYLFVAGVL